MNWRSHLERFLPAVVLTLLSLVVTPSILTPGKLLCTAVDGRHFLVRLYELSWLTDHGVLWPRWAPNLSYGYGYPVFHFYGSLSLYPSLLLHRLGLSLVTALQAGFWLALVLSGWAAYAWLHSVTGDERSALIGATAYLFIPYHINTAIYRLNLPEPWALVFLPLALHGLRRMAQRLDWHSVGVTALVVAALPLTSNLATIVSMPILVAYAVLLLLLSANRLHLLRKQLASAGLAFGVSAFFVVPAFVNRHSIQIERGYTPGGLNVFSHFLSLDRIFQQPFTADVSRVNPLYDPISLGFVAITASLIALAISWKRLVRDSQWHAVWAVAIGAGCVFMATQLSAPVYRTLSLLQVLQFPWRFLAPAALLAALLAAIASRSCLKAVAARRAQVMFSIIVALVLLGWPLLYPGQFCGLSPTPTLAEAVAYQIGMVGSLSTTAEYVPITVKEIPATSPMLQDYLNDRPVIRWDRSLLPDGARTLAIQDEGLWASWEVDTPVDFEAVYQAFMFPGWQATVDGQSTDIQIAPPYGLIQISVPAGHHTIAVRFGSTPDRTIAAILSIAALLTAGMLLFTRGRAASASRPRSLGTSTWIIVGGIGVALLAVRLGLVDRFDWLPRVVRFDGQIIRGVAHPTSVTYSGGQRLLGYKLLTRPTSSGDPLELDLYWATTTGESFRGLVRLTDEQGTAWTEWDKVVDFAGLIGPPGAWIWGPDRYTSMRYHVSIPPGTPPGEYNLSVATIDPETLTPHYVTQGTPLTAERTEAIVGRVTVRQKRVKAAKLGELALPGQPVLVDTADGTLTLVRCDATKDHVSVGEPVILHPLWYAESPPAIETLTLRLRDATGRVALEETLPFSSRYPTESWQPGELVRDRFRILIPASLPAGQYAWTAEVAGHDTPLGELSIGVPERHFDPPTDVTPVGETLDGFAELAGYRADPLVPGQPFPVTLYWRAREETTTNYKAFVHLLGPQGTIVAQSDAIPAAWTRLTTGWLPPEVIEDVHILYPPGDLAPGIYHAIVGFYEPETGRRATTPDGQDSITIVELATASP